MFIYFCFINNFPLQNMSEDRSIEEKAVYIQSTKNEMVQRIAELNELLHLKSELQGRSTQLKGKLQQLKNQLYVKQQKNVSLGLEKIQLKRQWQRQVEKQQSINSNKENVLSEISAKRQQGEKLQKVIGSIKDKSKTLNVRIQQLNEAKNNIVHQIKQYDKKIQFLLISSEKRSQISEKLRQSVKYFTQKSLLIKDKCENCKQVLDKIEIQSKSTKQSIQNFSLLASNTIKIVEDNTQQIKHEQQAIQSQKLKRKILKQKYTNLKQKLDQLQEYQKHCRIILDKKKTQAERKQHNQNLKLSKWKEIKAKVQLQIQYTQYFYQRIVL